MSTSTQNRQPPGRPTGGEYAPTVHAEPDVQLAADDYRPTVIRVGSLKVSNYSYRNEPMPEWPASLPQPDPYIVFDDGTPRVVLEVEGLPEVTFWRSDIDESCSSFDNGDEEWPGVDDEAIEQVQEYGNQLCDRVAAHVYGITMEACQAPGVQRAIMDDALLRGPEPASPRDEAIARAAAALGMTGNGEVDEERLHDLLTDLRHLAEKEGIDFDYAVERSEAHYSEESDDPSFGEPDEEGKR